LIINDNIFTVLPTIEECSQNLIFSDPPYNLSSKWKLQNDRVVLDGKGRDFMNKWDGLSDIDLETMFEEFYRILKHGGFCCMWSLSRQHLPFLYYSNKAGFENLQSISSYFISSFPKAMDLSKMLDKHYGEEREVIGKRFNGKGSDSNSGIYAMNNGDSQLTKDIDIASSHLAKKYDGYKSSICPLKEVSETLLVFRKPFKYKSIITDIVAKEENNETDIHGVGINIDGNRVGFTSNDDSRVDKNYNHKAKAGLEFEKDNYKGEEQTLYSQNGRYPSNLYLIDGFNYAPEQIKEILTNKQFNILENIGIDIEPLQYMLEEKQIEYVCNYLDKFEISKVLDEQSGILRSGSMEDTSGYSSFYFREVENRDRTTIHANHYEGCSRILHKCKYELNEFNIFNYTTKVSSFERNAGCDKLDDLKIEQSNANVIELKNNINTSSGKERLVKEFVKNNHPTLKNMNLQYKLMNLFLCPKEDIKDFKILIPFCGVQSEYIPAIALGILEENITGIEISKKYCEIGDARKEYWIKHNFYFKEDKKEKEELKNEAIKKDSGLNKKLF